MSKEMAREIKEILEGADPAQVAEFAGNAATAADAQAIKELAAGYGIQLADDEAGGIFAEMTRRSQEEFINKEGRVWQGDGSFVPLSGFGAYG